MCASTRRLIRVVQVSMLVAGAACIAWAFSAWKEAAFAQLVARAQLRGMIEARTYDGPTPLPLTDSIRALPSPVIGWLHVPRLSVSLGILEGDDDTTLRLAAGHLPDTPFPWEEGNSALAGHRDTFFRAIRDLRIGDDLSLESPKGTMSYRVTRARIVKPNDLSVLESGDGVALTLITCYPFTYLGLAPERYVVQAEKILHDASPQG
jgi:sortase A